MKEERTKIRIYKFETRPNRFIYHVLSEGKTYMQIGGGPDKGIGFLARRLAIKATEQKMGNFELILDRMEQVGKMRASDEWSAQEELYLRGRLRAIIGYSGISGEKPLCEQQYN